MKKDQKQYKPVILIILDGFGYSPKKEGNAIALAHTPQLDKWNDTYPRCLLEASSDAVGLPTGQMGNSEVGHMHMGAGRIVRQDLTRINHAIETGDFKQNATLLSLIKAHQAGKQTLHIMGLLSDGGVHSHQTHLFEFLKMAHHHGVNNIALHLFLDGRDTPPKRALESLSLLNSCLETYPVGKIATLSGRYFAMDRDKRWERIQPVYELITEGQSSRSFSTAEEAITSLYAEGLTDEFIPAVKIGNYSGMNPQDSIFFFNFRADRARQLTEAFLLPVFSGFLRKPVLLNHFLSMGHLADNLPTEVVFPPQKLLNTLGEILSKNGLKQLRIAETEKYAHVTFFFNGGTEDLFPLEDRLLIPSPAVATYDLQPEMSAIELTNQLIRAVQQQKYDVIICNYANADMVGHTGNLLAAMQAVETLDDCLARLGEVILAEGGCLLITADHGNVECMVDSFNHQSHTAHTTDPVPFLFIGEKHRLVADCEEEIQESVEKCSAIKSQGSLIDIAPTILALLEIEKPEEMTGKSLLNFSST